MREIYTQIYGTFCCWDYLDKSSIQQEEVAFSQQKALRLQAWTDPEGSRRLRLPDFFHQQTGLKFMGEFSKILHLERSVCMALKVETLESRSEIAGKLLNVLLEDDGEDHLD
jgi:hypothetical protein